MHENRTGFALKNLLTDIAGVRVGHADDARLASGVTAVIFDTPAVAAIDVRGGGPGTREAALLDLANTVERVDAFALAGGSAFGLEAGGGIQAWLAEQGRGFEVRGAVIPIVPGAILFDLLNGGVSRPTAISAMPRQRMPARIFRSAASAQDVAPPRQT
jgi:L-aminopeptidase/D-esterase-like protein